jgi:hypothetical protein
MNERFSYKEMKELLAGHSLQIGDTINIFHCKKGHNNDRLFITKKDDCVLFFCHHCGKKGKLNTTRAAYKKRTGQLTNTKNKPRMSTAMPADGILEPQKWPVEAMRWTSRAGMSLTDIEEAGMQYSPSFNRVIVPVSFEGQYNGWVGRRVGNDDSIPKYLAAYVDRGKNIYVCRTNTEKEIILVEDILSARKLAKAGYNSVALLGTSLSDEMFYYLTVRYNSFIIWLDNDNAQVKLNQLKLMNKLSVVGNVRIVKSDKDPKEYSLKEIEEILNANTI